MKQGDKVKINHGPFNGKKATVIKSMNVPHISNVGGIDVVCVELETGSGLILKKEHVIKV